MCHTDLMVQEVEREVGTVAVSDGNHSLKRASEAALQLLVRASAPMEQERELASIVFSSYCLYFTIVLR